MSLKQDFLAEISVGDQVSLLFGPQCQAEGVVLKLTEHTVRLQTASGTPRIALDSIISYDTAEASAAEPAPALSGPAAPADPAQRLEQRLLSSEPAGVETIADWEQILQVFQDKDNPHPLRSQVMSSVSSFLALLQNPAMPAAEREDKMHNIRAKLLNLAAGLTGEDDRLDLYALLASMYMRLGDYAQAEKYFAKAEDFYGASYAADFCGDSAQLDQDLDAYLCAPDCDPYLYRLYAQSASRRRDAAALCRRLKVLERGGTPAEDEWELLCACARHICTLAGLPSQWAADCAPDRAADCLAQFCAQLPEDWNRADAPAQNGQPEGGRLISQIHYFDPERGIGFLKHSPDNYFFHIKQVCKEDELREILAYGKLAGNLEVSFELGQPFQQGRPPQASAIRLTERGAREAKKRLSVRRPESGEALQGFFTEYSWFEGFGRIQCGDQNYNVIASGVADPYLKAWLFCRPHGIQELSVTFQPGHDKKGKPIALQVRLTGGPSPDPSELETAVREKAVTQSELDGWPDRKRRLEEGGEDRPLLDLYALPYEPLEPADPEPLRESGTPAPESAAPAPDFVPIPVEPAGSLPPLEDLPPRKHPSLFSNLTPIHGAYYEQAHQCRLQNQPAEAERLYLCALRAGDQTERTVADLTTLYLQDGERILDAVDLLDAYGDRLPSEKRMNLLLQIYQKGRERPFRVKLCHLLEEALAQPIRTSAKLHYLNIQGTALRNLGEYAMALDSYRRWRQLYADEVHSRGRSAQAQFSKLLPPIQRAEALCYYALKDKEHAEALARELLHATPTDAVARQILDGTLETGETGGQSPDAPAQEEPEAAQSRGEPQPAPADPDPSPAGTQEPCQPLPPELRLDLTEDITPYLSGGGQVCVHLTVRNGAAWEEVCRQSADNLSLQARSQTPGVEFAGCEGEPAAHLEGGSAMEVILVFCVTDSRILSLGTFDIEVQCRCCQPSGAPIEALWRGPAPFHRNAPIPNPFADCAGHVMEDGGMFYGREELLSKLLDSLRLDGGYRYGGGFLLYGQARAGKSSLYAHFLRRVREHPQYAGDVLLVDLQDLGSVSPLTDAAFRLRLADALQTEIRTNHPDVQAELERKDISIQQDQLLHSPHAALLFRRYAERVCTTVRNMNKLVVLMADGFSAVHTAIQRGEMSQGFLQTWKALVESYGVFAVCCGQDDLPAFCMQDNEGIFRSMVLERVPCLAEAPAKALMSEPIALHSGAETVSRYSGAALDSLYRLTAGSPFLILRVCSLLVEYLNQRGADRVTPGILERFLDAAVFSGRQGVTEGDFEPQISDRANPMLKLVNLRLLRDIALQSASTGWAAVEALTTAQLEPREGQRPDDRRMELLNRLAQRDVIALRQPGLCRIKAGLLARWLRR